MLPVRTTGTLIPRPALFAARNISEGEELTWDYQDAGGEAWYYGKERSGGTGEQGGIPCVCSSVMCRGFIPYDPNL